MKYERLLAGCLLMILVALFFAIGAWVGGRLFPYHGVVVDRTLPPLKAHFVDGQDVNAFLNHHNGFLFFGNTRCGGICYPRVRLFHDLSETLAEPLQYYFVTLDPDYDTAERLIAYFDQFGPDFHAIIPEENFFDRFDVRAEYQGDGQFDHNDVIFYIANGKIQLMYVGEAIQVPHIVSDVRALH